MKNLFVCYSRCSTCKRAEEWLKENKIDYEFRDIKENRPTVEELKEWHRLSGLPLKRFFNTSGLAYRSLGLSEKLPQMTEEELYALLATDGMLVKRPVFVAGKTILVGFRQPEWEKVLK